MYNNFYSDDNNTTYDPVAEQFKDSMLREGKKIVKYFSKEEIQVLFRRNTDKNSTQIRTTIFYDVSQDLQQGQLVTYKSEFYILMNKETAENSVYMRSDLIKTNCYISTISNGKELYIPCYSGDLLNPNPDNGNVITSIKGFAELQTENSEYTRNLKMNSTFNALGGLFKVVNLFQKDGLIHVYVEKTVTSEEKEFIIKIISDTNIFDVGSTVKLMANCKYGSETVTNPNLKWSSSDTSIATISNDGIALFLAEGNVAFSCLWEEHQRTDVLLVSVTIPVTQKNFAAIIRGSDTIKAEGTARTFTAKFFNKDGVEIDLIPKWNIDIPSDYIKYFKITYPSKNVISIQCNNEHVIGEHLKLILSDANNLCHTEKLITLVGLFS